MQGRVGDKTALANRPFPSYLKPLFQSEAWRTTIHMKMSLICIFSYLFLYIYIFIHFHFDTFFYSF